MIKMHSDLLKAIGKTTIVMTDISAVFHTVDRPVMLEISKENFGIRHSSKVDRILFD